MVKAVSRFNPFWADVSSSPLCFRIDLAPLAFCTDFALHAAASQRLLVDLPDGTARTDPRLPLFRSE